MLYALRLLGKAHKPYEFGVKVSFITNVNPAPGEHFILHAKALSRRPYDEHTLKNVLAEISSQTDTIPESRYVDKGYRGQKIQGKTRVYQSSKKRGITPSLKKELRQRSIVELMIGHAKQDYRMDRNDLYDEQVDAMNTILAAVRLNFRQLPRWFRKLFWLYSPSLLLSLHFRFKTQFLTCDAVIFINRVPLFFRFPIESPFFFHERQYHF